MGKDSSEWEEHLDELRRRIVSALAVFSIASALSFAVSERITAFLLSPLSGLGLKLYTFSPTEKFMAHLHISAVAGAILASPFILLQTGMFIWPGLKGRERTCARFALVAVPALFTAGSVVAYRFFAPAVLKFFLSFGSGDGVGALWSFREYLSLLAGLMLAVGIMLQMPLIMLALFALGIASPQKTASARPYVVLLIFLLAAILTPPDVTSQIMLGVPLYLLFEITLFAGKIMRRAKK
ncbi:MAG: twin-arginine translocase subunit TatC [Synergistaceae bacterium]|nr:twin-arginine translocase subunit TatC [Synergistaceae bacterium]